MHTEPVHPDSPAVTEPLLRPHYAWLLLTGLLLLAGPLFVGMPLNSDTALFDVQARTVLDGGVAYRDVIEPNLPGVLWVHMAVRSLVGWSSESMRVVDLMLFAAVLWLWSAASGQSAATRGVYLLVASFFYLTRNEWCHAQRDVWMLVPAGAAMLLRMRRGMSSDTLMSILEGICWGAAFWIKPHIVIPAATLMLLDLIRIQRLSALRDIAMIIVGGILAAVPGVLWLLNSGAWGPFLEMMLEWNPEYVAAGRERMSLDRWLMMSRRFAPWLWIHAVAVPIAVTGVMRGLRRGEGSSDRRQLLISGCYLGWLAQSVALQHVLDYIHVPGILLGLTVVCGHSWRLPVINRRFVVACFVLLAVFSTPLFRPQSLRQWPRVLTHGSTTDVRNRLAHGNLPDWIHLSEVIQYLNEQQVQDGDVTCMNVHSVHIYNETHTLPSTRFWSVAILQDLFPQRAAAIAATVRESRHRFVVVESKETSLIGGAHPNRWMEQLTPVFQSGSYRVLERRPAVPQLADRNQ